MKMSSSKVGRISINFIVISSSVILFLATSNAKFVSCFFLSSFIFILYYFSKYGSRYFSIKSGSLIISIPSSFARLFFPLVEFISLLIK